MNYYLAVIKKYAVFDGRAGRAEYWYFVLFNVIISVVLSIIDRGLHLNFNNSGGALSGLYSLAVLIPGLAVSVRRLHDIGKSGPWIFIALIPFIGWIWLLILMLTQGNPASNAYGSPTKPMETPKPTGTA